MIRKLLFATLLLLCIGTAWADVGYGLIAGFNTSNANNPNGTDTNIDRFGFNAGAFVLFQLPHGLRIQPELVFTNKGYRHDTDIIIATTSEYYNYNYAELAALLKYNLHLKDLKWLDVQPCAGLAAGIPVFGQYMWTDNADNLFPDRYDDFKADMALPELSLEAGVDLLLGDSVLLGFRYQPSLNEVFKPDSEWYNHYKSSLFKVNIGFIID